MSKEKHNNENAHTPESETPEVMDVLDTQETGNIETGEAMAEEESLQEQLDAALEQVEKDKQDYLMLMADFDNYRKRMMREKADLLKNASERVLTGLLPVLDDFERGLAACSANEADEAIYKGMELIYNKFVKYLESNGVKAMDTNGADFNADFHEAIATVPAPDQKGKIIDTTLKGYTINDKVLRHAKVVVGE
jgi:molecular chaperone GrpE